MNETAKLPNRPWCTKAEALVYVKAMTGESASTFYDGCKNARYPVRAIARRELLSTRELREIFEIERLEGVA